MLSLIFNSRFSGSLVFSLTFGLLKDSVRPARPQNINLVYVKYDVGSLNSYCIKSPYNCMFNHNKRNGGGCGRQIRHGDIVTF